MESSRPPAMSDMHFHEDPEGGEKIVGGSIESQETDEGGKGGGGL